MMDNIPNIINKDGVAIYYPSLLNEESIAHFYAELFNKINWDQEKIKIFGNEITTKRKVAFYSDPQISYTYSGKTKIGLPWIASLIQLKEKIELITNVKYNACLLNLYHDGEEGMGWHSDNEKEIVPESSIASLSIGASRKFSFKHKITNEIRSILLENGSLLEMKGAIQKHWLHALPKSKKITSPRINLTFRQMQFEK